MPNTFKVLFRGAASISNTTLYTVPSSTTTLINSIVITNTASVAGIYDLSLNDVVLANDVSVPGNDSVILELKQVITSGQTIKGLASSTNINFHISGLEIT